MSRTATIMLRSARSINLRSLHTSITALYSELPPTPNSAEALGFKNQTDRQRQLPKDLKINIPATSKKSLPTTNERKPRSEGSKSKRIILNPKSSNQEASSLDSDSPDFFNQSDLSSTTPSSSRPPSSKSKSRRDIKGVSMDIINESSSSSSSSLPPDVVRRQRRDNRQTNNQRQGPGGQRPQNKGRNARRSRDNVGINVNSREKRVLLPKRQIVLDAMDQPKNGLFGKNALLLNANSKEGVIAHLGHPRKTSSIRQTSSTPQFPSSPIPILSTIPAKSAEQAIQIASWTAALNGSIAPRVKSTLSETVKAQLGR